MENENTIREMFIVALNVDISCTPGSTIYEIDGMFFDRTLAEQRCEELNDKLDEELGDGEEDGDTEEGDEGYDERFGDDDDWDSDDEYMGFNLSSRPYWSVDTVTVKG